MVADAKRDRMLSVSIENLIPKLAALLGCEVGELRLDHDPPLAQRPQERRGLGRKTYYTPAANDPEHLFYRPHGPQHAGSHLIKTNVRGDHGQHPDRVLIVKARKLEKRKAAEKAVRARKSPMAVPKPPRAAKRARGAIPGRRAPLSGSRARQKRPRIEVPVTNVTRAPTGTWGAKRPRWAISLGCGHSIYVMRESRPAKRTVRCKLCEARQKSTIHRTPMRGR